MGNNAPELPDDNRKIIQTIDDEIAGYDEIEYEPNITVSGKALWDLRALAEQAIELQQSFDLRWKADMRAIKMWQDAGGDKLTWPDHCKLVEWLLEQLETRADKAAKMDVEALKNYCPRYHNEKYPKTYRAPLIYRNGWDDCIDHLSASGYLSAPSVMDLGKELFPDKNGNGGFIQDLCYTVWDLCHKPKNEDGNTDWFSDTKPTVMVGIEKIRSLIDQQAAPDNTVIDLQQKLLKKIGEIHVLNNRFADLAAKVRPQLEFARKIANDESKKLQDPLHQPPHIYYQLNKIWHSLDAVLSLLSDKRGV